MKVIRNICIEAEVWGAVQEKRINASSICNEALRLAAMTGATGQDGEMSAAIKRRAEMEKDISTLRRIHDKHMDRFPEAARIFCDKYTVVWADAVALAEGKKKGVSPAPLPQNKP